MTERGAPQCAEFEAAVDELATGMADERERAALLEHARQCEVCEDLLTQTLRITERLLHFAPDAEPPLGFESRAVAAMTAPSPPKLRRSSRLAAISGAVGLAVALTVGVAIGRTTSPSASGGLEGAIVAVDGRRIGTAELDAAPHARVVLTLYRTGTATGDRRVACELQTRDGRWVEVGTWTAAEVTNGVWAAGVDDEIARSPSMRIRDADGRTLATATLR